MTKFYIVHRWDGNSNCDWLPYIKEKLTNEGAEITAFDMPETERPDIEKWISFLSQNITELDGETYFIGHSIGCQAIMRFLEKQDKKIGGAFFVAPWLHLVNLENEDSEEIARPWLETPINFEKLIEVVPFFEILFSSNDEFVSLEKNKKAFEENLHCNSHVLQNKGHFTADESVTELPELFEIIKSKDII